MTGLAHGKVDAQGRLVEAEPALAQLQEAAGSAVGQTIAVPQIATLARLAQRLGILVSRCVIAADGADDLDLWVQAKPEGDLVALSVGGWARRPARPGEVEPERRVFDFARSRGDWLWETDPALKLTSLGAPDQAGLIGEPLTRLFDFIQGEDGGLPILEAIAARVRFEGQDATVRATGRRVRVTGLPLIDGGGRFAGYRGSAFQLEAPAEAEDAMPAKPDVFGGRLERALRAPLARIVEQAERIGGQADGAIRRDYADYAGDIANAGRHLLGLIDDLVDLRAVERHDFRPGTETIDLAELARRAAGLLALQSSERGVRLAVPGAEQKLPGLGDHRRVLQILVNLIGNAVRHSPTGGTVRIDAGREGEMARISVIDQGPGIAPVDQERVFEKFIRLEPTDPGGSGLGLYIARRLARAMSGEVKLTSAAGQGACFTLELPVGPAR